MALPTTKVIATLVLLLTAFVANLNSARAQDWARTVKSSNNDDRTTTLEFYFHDTPSSKSPSAVTIAQPINANLSQDGFGVLVMADDPLTVGPDPTSKLVGRAQGLYGSACQDEAGLIMVLSYSFTDGMYNGSSISILGRNSVMHPVREMPVVGGTGLFRMARGYALARTRWFDMKTGNAVVGYNVTIVH